MTDPRVQVQLLVWIFVMRIMMIIASGVSYLINAAWAKASFGAAATMNFETPLTRLVWLTSIVSVAATYIVSYILIPEIGGDPLALVEALDRDHVRDAGRRDHSGAGEDLHLHGVGARA